MHGSNSGRLIEDVPSHFEIRFDASEIDIALTEASREVNKWIQTVQGSGGEVLIVGNLHGGDFILGDLRASLPFNVRYGFVKTSSYKEGDIGVEKESAKVVTTSFDPKSLSKRTHILLVDDICDRGRSLRTLEEWLLESGVNIDRIRSFVLLLRQHDERLFTPTWSVFTVEGDNWFVGRGMQERGFYRGCRNIYSIPNPT